MCANLGSDGIIVNSARPMMLQCHGHTLREKIPNTSEGRQFHPITHPGKGPRYPRISCVARLSTSASDGRSRPEPSEEAAALPRAATGIGGGASPRQGAKRRRLLTTERQNEVRIIGVARLGENYPNFWDHYFPRMSPPAPDAPKGGWL